MKISRRLLGTSAAVATTAGIGVLGLDLTRRAAKVDAPAARMLVPYVVWVAFATALNAAIAQRNPGGRP